MLINLFVDRGTYRPTDQKPWVYIAQVNREEREKKKRDQMERGWRWYKMEYLQSEEWTWTICKTVGSNSLQERTTRNSENKHKEERFISCLPVSSQRSQHIKQMFSVNKSLWWHTASSGSSFPSLWFNRSLLIKWRKNWRQSARGANLNPLKVIPYEQLHHETIPNPRSERAKSLLKRNPKWVGKGFKKHTHTHTHTQTQSCLKASVLINFHLSWNKLPKTT